MWSILIGFSVDFPRDLIVYIFDLAAIINLWQIEIHFSRIVAVKRVHLATRPNSMHLHTHCLPYLKFTVQFY